MVIWCVFQLPNPGMLRSYDCRFHYNQFPIGNTYYPMILSSIIYPYILLSSTIYPHIIPEQYVVSFNCQTLACWDQMTEGFITTNFKNSTTGRTTRLVRSYLISKEVTRQKFQVRSGSFYFPSGALPSKSRVAAPPQATCVCVQKIAASFKTNSY